MASSVFYRFKSRKEESRVNFDGTGISVFDLKREILLANNLGKTNDFDLALYDTNEQEYKDDSTIIPRSSSVIVKIQPPARPGKGKAAQYLTGALDHGQKNASSSSWSKGPAGPMSRRFDISEDPTKAARQAIALPSSVQGDEAASIAAMFQADAAQWEETQEKMAHAVRIHPQSRYNAPRRPYNPTQVAEPSSRPTPPGYVCYRCGQKGHWIQDCPTNNDREFDNRPRIKRTTGIPRSFLKPVEQPSDGNIQQGVMVTPDGGYVIAQPDSAAWQKQRTRQKILTEADVREKQPTDSSLACPLCSKLIHKALKTPCCEKAYCGECIQTHLLERDFECPSCHQKIPSLDKLSPDKSMQDRVKAYIDNAIEQSRARNEEEDAAGGGSQPPQAGASSEDAQNLDDQLYAADQPTNTNAMFPQPEQIQAQIDQIHVMLRGTSLTPAARMSLQQELQKLSAQLTQAKIAATLTAAFSAGAFPPPPEAFMTGMPAMAFQQPTYRPTWTNPFPNQQPAGADSAYQRLPVNNRRRGIKRDRPSDFVEVGADGAPGQKVARYWE